MSSPDIEFDDSFFAWLGNSPEVLAMCTEAASQILGAARAGAPVDTGDYRDSLHLEVEQHSYRKTVKVVAGDPKAMIIEAATGNLARSLGATSGRKGRG